MLSSGVKACAGGTSRAVEGERGIDDADTTDDDDEETTTMITTIDITCKISGKMWAVLLFIFIFIFFFLE